MKARALAVAAVLAVSAGCATNRTAGVGETAAPGVLIIGNSLTYWHAMPSILEELLRAAGFEPRVAYVAGPDLGLEDHWRLGTALDSIRSGSWDIVAMQQGPSATLGRPSLLLWSQRFADSIRAVGAEPAMYMVWPPESLAFEFADVDDSYATAADYINGLLIPVGRAWATVRDSHPQIQLYGPDRFHPSPEGSYLAGLVFFASVTGRSTVGLPHRTAGTSIEPAVARILQEAADAAVFRGPGFNP